MALRFPLRLCECFASLRENRIADAYLAKTPRTRKDAEITQTRPAGVSPPFNAPQQPLRLLEPDGLNQPIVGPQRKTESLIEHSGGIVVLPNLDVHSQNFPTTAFFE